MQRLLYKGTILLSFAIVAILVIHDFTYAQRVNLGGRGGRDPMVWAKIPCTYYVIENQGGGGVLQGNEYNLRYYQKDLIYTYDSPRVVSQSDIQQYARSIGHQIQGMRVFYRTDNRAVQHSRTGYAVAATGWYTWNMNSRAAQSSVQATAIRILLTVAPVRNFADPVFTTSGGASVRVERQSFKAEQVRRSEARRNRWEEISAREAQQINANCPCER